MRNVLLIVVLALAQSTALAQSRESRGSSREGSMVSSYRDATTEALAITVNPSSGTDPAAGVRLVSQAEWTALGTAASVAGVIAALPPNIKHVITITHADGSFTVTPATYFGDLSRLSFGQAGQIDLKSTSGVCQVGGTSDIDVLSSSNQTITLDADPGFSADQYAGYFAYVSSGTGSGQTLAIRSHTGTTMVVAGQIPTTLGASSVIQIALPCTIFNTTTNDIVLIGSRPSRSTLLSTVYVDLRLVGIGITSTNKTAYLSGMMLGMTNTRWANTALSVGDGARIRSVANGSSTSANVFDSGGTILTGVVVQGGSWGGTATNSTQLFRGGTTQCVQVIGRGSFAYSMFNATRSAFDCVTGIYASGQGAVVSMSLLVQGTNSAYAIRAKSGAYASLILSEKATLPTGTTSAIDLDGTNKTYDDWDNDANDVLIGVRGSMVTATTNE